MTMSVQTLLDQAVAILPWSRDDIIYKGVAAGISERIVELKRSASKMQRQYGSMVELERKIRREGVSPTITRFTLTYWNGALSTMRCPN